MWIDNLKVKNVIFLMNILINKKMNFDYYLIWKDHQDFKIETHWMCTCVRHYTMQKDD
jgi:hypothetical protein